jgi:protein-ribulosamine 3-kinase
LARLHRSSKGEEEAGGDLEALLAAAREPQTALRDPVPVAAEGATPAPLQRQPPQQQSILRFPRPWLVGAAAGDAFIAMEALDLSAGGRGGDGGEFGRRLGSGLGELHESPALHPRFGFPIDGCCGAAPQPNNASGRSLDWVAFWGEFRLGHQLDMLRQKYPEDRKLLELGQQLQKRLPELFSMLRVEDIPRSFLHGDLWSGNFGADAGGGPVMFDLAGYYGHDEADLGIARMFGGFPPAFWEAYHERRPKQPGFERRADLYELHHHMNHMNIFGRTYRSGCVSLLEKILDAKHY